MSKYAVILLIINGLLVFSCNNKNSSHELFPPKMITKDTTFYPEGVCCKQMDISVVNDTVQRVIFTKGCAGNAQGVARLIKGLPIDSAIARLEGICCGSKTTSCPDQLAKALKSMKK